MHKSQKSEKFLLFGRNDRGGSCYEKYAVTS